MLRRQPAAHPLLQRAIAERGRNLFVTVKMVFSETVVDIETEATFQRLTLQQDGSVTAYGYHKQQPTRLLYATWTAQDGWQASVTTYASTADARTMRGNSLPR